jgi:hypothetical protein
VTSRGVELSHSGLFTISNGGGGGTVNTGLVFRTFCSRGGRIFLPARRKCEREYAATFVGKLRPRAPTQTGDGFADEAQSQPAALYARDGLAVCAVELLEQSAS